MAIFDANIFDSIIFDAEAAAAGGLRFLVRRRRAPAIAEAVFGAIEEIEQWGTWRALARAVVAARFLPDAETAIHAAAYPGRADASWRGDEPHEIWAIRFRAIRHAPVHGLIKAIMEIPWR